MSNLPYYLGFSYHLGIGPYRLDNLIASFGTIRKAYFADRSGLIKVLTPEAADKFITFRQRFDPITELQKLRKKGIRVISRESSMFPDQLRKIPDKPICLFVKGNPEVLKLAEEWYFSIVGTRKASAYGLQIAREYAQQLVERGFTIVSGMALGIDGAAHRAALESNGATIAVLGSGVDCIYPSHHSRLYESIIENGGAVISEFAPHQPALPGLFVVRNRIISGLSKGILVVEGAHGSGSYITGKNGLEQDKNVFAIPGSPTYELAETPNKLIQNGAFLTTQFSDILVRYNVKISKKKKWVKHDFTTEQKQLFSILLKKPKTADDLSIEIQKPIYQTLSILSQLEILGDIEKNEEGKYQII
jgi:DNA processing protein